MGWLRAEVGWLELARLLRWLERMKKHCHLQCRFWLLSCSYI